MVKGVSKQVIVVNNTGNKYFEKIVFYVTPEYSNISTGKLNTAAVRYLGGYDIKLHCNNQLRSRYKKRRNLRVVLISVLALIVISVAVAVVL